MSLHGTEMLLGDIIRNNSFLKFVAVPQRFNHLFAILPEVILSKTMSIFSHIHLLFHFLEGKGIIYHLIAYDLVKKNQHGNRFLGLKVEILKYPDHFL